MRVGGGGFVNRAHEIQSALKFLSAGATARMAIWDAKSASGLSTFLRHMRELLQEDAYVFYVDCASQAANSVFSQIALTLYDKYRNRWGDFNRWMNKQAGQGSMRAITEAALEGLPWVGPSLRQAVQEISSPFDRSHYPSATAELICRYLIELRAEKPIALLLDNGQELDQWSVGLLQTTTGKSYSGFNYLFTVVERPQESSEKASEVRDRASILAMNCSTESFPQPSPLLVRELYAEHGVAISDTDAIMILEAARGNIYGVLRALRVRLHLKCGDSKPIVAPAGIEMLSFLTTAQQALRASDLYTLILSCPWIAPTELSEASMESAMEQLEDDSVVRCTDLPDGDRLVQLEHTSHETASRGSAAAELVIADHLYKYFARVRHSSLRHSKAEVLPLLYRLAKLVEPTSVPGLTQDIITMSQRTGSLAAAKRFVDLATIPDSGQLSSFADFVAQAAFLISARLYQKAYDTILTVNNKEWQSHRLYHILKAVSLNRCRQHAESLKLLRTLIDTSERAEERVLLLSYMIVGLLHANSVDEARAVFSEWRPRLRSARNYGYFLRNGASCYPAMEATAVLKEAERSFERSADSFGYATALNNKAAALLDAKKFPEAVRAAEAAHSSLEVFGVHHLHIAKNNLGLTYLLMNDCDGASREFNLAISLARTSMPRIFSQVNLSAAHCLAGRASDSVSTLIGMKSEVDRHPVDRVRQKFYVNAALILSHSGSKKELVLEMLAAAERHPDRMEPEITRARVTKLRELGHQRSLTLATLRELFYPASLLYWYQNPLEGLPIEVLASEAEL